MTPPRAYLERPMCQGCGKHIPYGQKYLHAQCSRKSESVDTELDIRNLYEVYGEDPTFTDSELVGIFTSFGIADFAASGKGPSGTKGYIKVVKGIVYEGRAYIMLHTVTTPVDIVLTDEDYKRQLALDKLSDADKKLLGLES